jgi:hypothetical protein
VAAQSKHDGISGALSAIDGKIATLTQQLKDTRAAEDRAAKEQRLKELREIEIEKNAEPDAIMAEMNAAV